MQLAINRVADWTESHGFRFSVEKSHALLFGRTRYVFPEPSLTLYRSPLAVVREVRFLGMIFDKRLIWAYLRADSCVSVLLNSSVTCPTILEVLTVLLYFVFTSYFSVLNWIAKLISIVLIPLVPSAFWTLSKTRACAWRLVHLVLLLLLPLT